jgi:hypothetical protein
MRNVKTVVTIIVAALLVPSIGVGPVAAQDNDPRPGLFLGGGVNFTQGSTKIGGDTGSKFGVGFTGIMAGVKSDGFRNFSIDLQIEPFEVQNPQRDERYSSLSVVVSGYLGPVGLGLGWQQRTWSGTDVWVESDGGIALQLTAALPELPVGSWAASPDAFVRLSGGDEISTTSLGLRVLFGRLVG